MAEPFKLHLTDPDMVQAKVEEYFEGLQTWEIVSMRNEAGEVITRNVPGKPRIPGMAGLAYALGMTRMGLWQYLTRAKGTEDEAQRRILHVLAQARARIEAAQEEALFDKDAHRGAVFSLGVNFRWGAEDTRPVPPPQEVIPPAPDGQALAIPKWGQDEDSDDG